MSTNPPRRSLGIKQGKKSAGRTPLQNITNPFESKGITYEINAAEFAQHKGKEYARLREEKVKPVPPWWFGTNFGWIVLFYQKVTWGNP